MGIGDPARAGLCPAAAILAATGKSLIRREWSGGPRLKRQAALRGSRSLVDYAVVRRAQVRNGTVPLRAGRHGDETGWD